MVVVVTHIAMAIAITVVYKCVYTSKQTKNTDIHNECYVM